MSPPVPDAAPGPPPRPAGLTVTQFVGACTAAAALVHLVAIAVLPLGVDEAATWLATRHGPAGAWDWLTTDGHPPLYFLLHSLWVAVAGSSETAVRLPSLAFAVALVPLTFVAARTWFPPRAAAAAAALAAASPLVHYHAVTARPYTLVMLVALLVWWTLVRALAGPARPGRWAAFGAALAAALYTHNHAIFLLPVPCVAVWLGTEPGERRRPLAAAAAASAAAFVCYLPWFRIALRMSGAGVAAWIREYWSATPPALAIPRSLEVFGISAHYPGYLAFLGDAAAGPLGWARVVTIACTLTLLALAVRYCWRVPAERRRLWVLAAFALGPLLGAFGYSLFVQPVYLVGRYDVIAAPAVWVLLGLGWHRLLERRPPLAVGAAAVSALVAAAAVAGSFPSPPAGLTVQRDLARQLATEARAGETLVCFGMSRPEIEYYLHRAGRPVTLLSFPAEVEHHPAWYDETALWARRAALAAEARRVAERLIAEARAGRSVWINGSPYGPIDDLLRRPLLQALDADRARSRPTLGLLCLRPR